MNLSSSGTDPRNRLLENLKKGKIPGLDGLRGIAALCVVGFHYQVFTSGEKGLMFPGRLAVQVFFVISGLLITWLLLREEDKSGTINRSEFYWRRAFRLLPPLLVLLLWQEITHLPGVARGGAVATAFYVANYYELIRGTSALNGLGQTWSLAVEEHFYLIWPLLFFYVRNRRNLMRTCLIVMGLQLVWRMALGLDGKYVYAELASETASCAIFAGCALALLLWQSPGRLPRFVLAPWLAPVSLLALLGLAQLPRNAQLWWAVPLAIPFAAILILQAIAYEWRVLENPVGRFLGRISYGIYLWGMVAIAIVERIGLNRGHILVFALVIALASASYFFVERPAQVFGREWLNRRKEWKQPLVTESPNAGRLAAPSRPAA
jgi:peptidoglycan/LPS O-acetylase OafA/YrhL